MPSSSQPDLFGEVYHEMERSAKFSNDRKYRYELWRRWKPGGEYAAFICLNPSTADETADDPTVRRCIDYSQRWGYHAFCMLNLFAFRATDPRVMKAAIAPVGAFNDEAIRRVADGAGIVVAAWETMGPTWNATAP